MHKWGIRVNDLTCVSFCLCMYFVCIYVCNTPWYSKFHTRSTYRNILSLITVWNKWEVCACCNRKQRRNWITPPKSSIFAQYTYEPLWHFRVVFALYVYRAVSLFLCAYIHVQLICTLYTCVVMYTYITHTHTALLPSLSPSPCVCVCVYIRVRYVHE